MNRLSKEKAAYLRHSATQRINWYPWCEEAFDRAKTEDKPVFLSSGAIWCHWCHVMAKESFEDDEVVQLLNDNCINIKLDRDERPDIDRIYQQAVAAMGSGGGWPLSVFLTPDKKPFFGGTYFPPEDSLGRPGFRKVIGTVVDYYHSKGAEVSDYVTKLIDFLKPQRPVPAAVNESFLDDAVGGILSEFDPQNGGFGTAPKFPMPGALEFLMGRYFISRDESVRLTIRTTLESMAGGGFCDHLGGGFHRYSVDEAWIIPHFEKMADDNAWLLRNYSDAYRLFNDDAFRNVAEGIVRFVTDVLSDPEGGYYASQDADVTVDDEGGYFTWTEDEFNRVLSSEEQQVLSLHLFHERGSMHHNSSKRVLFRAMEPADIARDLGMEITAVREFISAGKEKLLRERLKRQSPFVDRTLYTSLNGTFITSYLSAYRALKRDDIRDFALKSLKRIMDIHYKGGELFHTEGVKALLEDYAAITDAHISAYEITGEENYLVLAEELMEQCIRKFWDRAGGGFFESEDEIVGVRLKGIEDIPHPSPNAVAILNLIKLSSLTDKDLYIRHAEEALAAFSFRARDMGIHAGYYARALDMFFHVIRFGIEAAPQSDLADAARSAFNPFVALRYGRDRGYVTPCKKGSCYEALTSAQQVGEFLTETARHWNP
jgi:uncharacterized protein YyaL (SSP411 family)